MSDPRDDLAALIFDKSGLGEWSATQLADAILAAGWRAPVPHCDHDWHDIRDLIAPPDICGRCGQWRPDQ